jgi:anti-anti-sigma regulatory factor
MTLKRKPMAKTSPIATVTETVILVTREGEWLPPEELRAISLSAVDTDGNLTVNLEGVEHLDASALQILLALAAERKKRGKGLRLANASLALSRWFEYAGGGRTSLLHVSVNGHA